MVIGDKTKFELKPTKEQKKMLKEEQAEPEAKGLRLFLSNPVNVTSLAAIGFIVLFAGIAAVGRMVRDTESKKPQASQPGISVRRAEDDPGADPSLSSASTDNPAGVTVVTRASDSDKIIKNGTDRQKINNSIYIEQSKVAADTASDIVLYPIEHPEFPSVPVTTDCKDLPYGQVIGYIDTDTLVIKMSDGQELNVNLAGIKCNPPGGKAGASLVYDWLNEFVTGGEIPYAQPGFNYVYLEYATEAPQMSDGSYNAYVWFFTDYEPDTPMLLNEQMLIAGFAEPDHETVNREYYTYFKKYPYIYQDIG